MECRSGSQVYYSSERVFADWFILIRSYFRQGYERFDVYPPGFYPVDILEFTPGRKDLQTYTFMGGIATDISPNWRLGGKIDFAASNYSKRKDVRHTNYRLDLKVAPGIMYHSGELAIGLSYIFGKNSESVKAEVIGTAENSYNAFSG